MDQLPTVRRLAADLGLAPNTVPRAYRELEQSGLLDTRGRFLARFPAVDRAWIEARTRRQVALGNLAFAGRLLRVAPGRWLWHDAIAADLLG